MGRFGRDRVVFGVLALAMWGCSNDQGKPVSGTGGAGVSTGGAAGGSVATGGTSSSGGSSASGGTSATGGTSSSGGSSASGGTSATGGTSSSGGVDGGPSTGGTGGSGGVSGVGGVDGGGGVGGTANVVAAASGTRLKAKFVSAPDGSRVYKRGVLYDSQLGVDCSFRTAADDTLRCLPLPPDPFGQSFGWGDVVYTDSACTNGLLWVQPPPSGCSAVVPVYAMSSTDPPYCSGEDPRTHIFTVGALLAPQSGPFYYINGSGNCVSGGVMPTSALPYSIGSEVAASTFVAGTRQVSP